MRQWVESLTERQLRIQLDYAINQKLAAIKILQEIVLPPMPWHELKVRHAIMILNGDRRLKRRIDSEGV